MYSSKESIVNGVSIGHFSRMVRLFVLLLVTAIAIPAFGQLALVPGDANGDGNVNLDDFIILKQNYGTSGNATWEMGDFNGDWVVNLDDFIILKQNYGTSVDYNLTLDLGNGIEMQLVRIPAGTFMMGSPEDELGRWDNEGPQHQVTLTQPFYMGIYEVTQEQYQAVMETNPSYFPASRLNTPVEWVSWNDAIDFCETLSQITGRTVTLPTEAQWEYACRAGTQTRFYYGDDLDYSLLGDYAWYGYFSVGNNVYGTNPVGEKIPNAWGLYDMHGNIWEWCRDWYASYTSANNTDPHGPQTGIYRVFRGGTWDLSPSYCRSANRLGFTPDDRDFNLGFRVVVSSAGMD